jgi:hypothetical protein
MAPGANAKPAFATDLAAASETPARPRRASETETRPETGWSLRAKNVSRFKPSPLKRLRPA